MAYTPCVFPSANYAIYRHSRFARAFVCQLCLVPVFAMRATAYLSPACLTMPALTSHPLFLPLPHRQPTCHPAYLPHNPTTTVPARRHALYHAHTCFTTPLLASPAFFMSLLPTSPLFSNPLPHYLLSPFASRLFSPFISYRHCCVCAAGHAVRCLSLTHVYGVGAPRDAAAAITTCYMPAASLGRDNNGSVTAHASMTCDSVLPVG